MRKVCPNLDREDGGLDTVLEVPLPELNNDASGRVRRRRRTVKAWVRSHMEQRHRRDGTMPSRADVQLMLGVIGAPLVLQPVESRKAMAGQDIKEEPLEVSKARYIVEQYVAAAGGEAALNAATSMYAMGNVRMRTTKGQKAKTGMGVVSGGEVAGGFVLWQKRQPEQWCVEMVVAGGTKMSAGSDGKVAWRQSPWQQAHASRGPPRPLRRCVQGLDPKSTADLFATAAWVGEKHIDGDDCFVLRVDADPAALRARSGADVEVVRHAVWGYFSQRTGLLARLEDSHLLRIRVHGEVAETTAYWETSMESSIGDYRAVDGVNVAHAGRTTVSLSRFGGSGGVEDADDARGKRTCTCMEETWSIEEVDFNIVGLSNECFLPPSDMIPCGDSSKPATTNKESVVDHSGNKDAAKNNNNAAQIEVIKVKMNGSDDVVRPVAAARKALVPPATGLGWFGPAKVVAVETVDADV
ncbi:hypothetical protein PR202_ga11650 [Eleusine coracana subsp. coracana]|uniref:Uncharacterized protein n=1 Tax=Eleusine coracana subsp. coracana TaxID=191504 RepID=A0AAV5CA08_ELECO|nr:hypothetical protein PR202_ga11650 [Eleusine coracana subsp. coracana]